MGVLAKWACWQNGRVGKMGVLAKWRNGLNIVISYFFMAAAELGIPEYGKARSQRPGEASSLPTCRPTLDHAASP